jgi:hypothetical protein
MNRYVAMGAPACTFTVTLVQGLTASVGDTVFEDLVGTLVMPKDHRLTVCCGR